MRLTFLVKLLMILCYCLIAYSFVRAQKRDSILQNKDSLVGSAKHHTVNKVINVKDNVLPLQTKIGGGILKKGKETLNPVISKIKLLQGKPKFNVNNLTISTGYTYIHDTSVVAKGAYNNLTGIFSYSTDYGVAISGIPFKGSVNGNNGLYAASGTKLNELYNFNFDPAAYRELLQKEVTEKISPDIVLGAILKRINSIKDSYKENLKQDIKRIKDDFVAKYGKELDIPEDATDIAASDINALKTKLFGSVSSASYNEGMERYNNLLKNSGTAIDSLQVKDALFEAEKMEVLQKAYQKVSHWKEKFENNPTVKKLQSHLPFTPENYKAYLNEPGKLAEVIKKYGSLSTLQSLFLNLTKLDLGQNPVENGQFSVQHLMNTGINTSFQNNKIGAGLIAGVNNNPNNWLQAGLNSFVTNEYSNMAGITLGTGSSSRFNQSISVNLFNFSNPSWAEDPTQYLQSSYLPTARRKDAVVTLHSGMKISEAHEVTVDISKSFGSFQSASTAGGTESGKTAMKGLLGNEGRSNYAIAFDYRGQILKTDLQLLFKNAGLGYSNPGNMFIRRGETQIQAGVARKLFHQKLTVKYKTDYRNQHFDPEKRYTYATFSNKINGSWKIKKNSRAGLSYQQSNYTSTSPLGGKIKGSSNIVQADGTYKFRLNRKFITNTEILTFQRMVLPSLNGEVYDSRSVFFAHTTTVPVNKSFVIVTAMVNQSNNNAYYFNTSSVNAEASYNYMLFEKIQMMSGGGYYVNNGWNKQVGVKQSFSFTASRKINIDFGVDIKKAVKIIRSELANPIFINTSVSYKL